MNRMDEYKEWMKELEQPVMALEGTLVRAQKKRRRKRAILVPVLSMAAVFALFVLAVNCSDKVAYACSKVPILKELAEAVTFSRSLTDAVEKSIKHLCHWTPMPALLSLRGAQRRGNLSRKSASS